MPQKLMLCAILALGFSAAVLAQDHVAQVAAFSEPVKASYFTNKGLTGVYGEVDHNAIYRYYLGPFPTEDMAIRAAATAKAAGFKYARAVNLKDMRDQCALACAPLNNQPTLLTDDPIPNNTDLFIRNIFFDFNRSFLKDRSIADLDKLHEILTNNPDYRVELHGHTDWVGTDDYNQTLSERRAYKVRNYLLEKGIPRSRLLIKGFGEHLPIAKNQTADGKDSETGRQLNRRVELRIIDETGQILWDMVEPIAVPAGLEVK